MNQPVIVQPAERVPIERALSVGWEGMTHKFLMILCVMLISGFFAGMPILAYIFGYDMIQRHLLLVLLLAIYQIVVSAVIWLGLLKMSLHVNHQQPFTVDDFLAVGAQLPSYFGASIIRFIFVAAGYMFFFFPGVLIQTKLDQADYFIVDRKMGPIAALEASWRATNGAVLMLWLFGIITFFVQFVGWCALLIGALPANMIVLLSKAHVYENLIATSPDPILAAKLAVPAAADATLVTAAQPDGVVGATGIDAPAPPSGGAQTSDTPSPPADDLQLATNSLQENQASAEAQAADSTSALASSETAAGTPATETPSPARSQSINVTPPSEVPPPDQAASDAPPSVPPNIAAES